jgi:hypothetical protein
MRDRILHTIPAGTKCFVKRVGEPYWREHVTKKEVRCRGYLWTNAECRRFAHGGWEIQVRAGAWCEEVQFTPESDQAIQSASRPLEDDVLTLAPVVKPAIRRPLVTQPCHWAGCRNTAGKGQIFCKPHQNPDRAQKKLEKKAQKKSAKKARRAERALHTEPLELVVSSTGSPHFSTGPHKGVPLENLPLHYLEKVAGNHFLSELILAAVRGEMESRKNIDRIVSKVKTKRRSRADDLEETFSSMALPDYASNPVALAVLEQLRERDEEMAL